VSTVEERLAAIEARQQVTDHYIEGHEAEHKNLQSRIEDQLRSKWKTDLKAQSDFLEGKLKAQDGQLATILDKTAEQTPLLRKIRKGQRASEKERVLRVAREKADRDLAVKAADAKKDADEAFERKRNRVLLALAVLAGLGTAYATVFRH
jgi:hypothetical protein